MMMPANSPNKEEMITPTWANVLRKLTRDNKKEKSSAPTDNQIYGFLPAKQFSPSPSTTLDGFGHTA